MMKKNINKDRKIKLGKKDFVHCNQLIPSTVYNKIKKEISKGKSFQLLTDTEWKTWRNGQGILYRILSFRYTIRMILNDTLISSEEYLVDFSAYEKKLNNIMFEDGS